jgi:hypothetical protein
MAAIKFVVYINYTFRPAYELVEESFFQDLS